MLIHSTNLVRGYNKTYKPPILHLLVWASTIKKTRVQTSIFHIYKPLNQCDKPPKLALNTCGDCLNLLLITLVDGALKYKW
jgi:hypothetical protein